MTVDVSKLYTAAIRNNSNVTAVTKYSVYVIRTAEVIVDLALRWNIEDGAEISVSLGLLWNVQATDLPPIETSLPLLWDMAGTIEATLPLQWNIDDGAIRSDLPLLWNIYDTDPSFTVSLALQWNVEGGYADPSRVIIPDMPITETWAFQTGIFRSKNGKEQRRSYIDRPVVYMSHSALNMSKRDFEGTRRVTEVDTYTLYPIPQYQYYDFLAVPTGAAGLTLKFDPIRTNIIAGEFIAVTNDETYEVLLAQVDAVAADGCTIIAPLGKDVDEGWYVAPVRFCRLNANGSAALAPLYADVSYNYVSGDRSAGFVRAGMTFSPLTLDGTIILDRYISADSSVNEQFISGVATLDNLRAAPVMFSNEPTRRQIDLEYLIQRELDSSQMDFWRGFALATVGSLKTFAVPTYRTDADVSAAPALGAVVVDMLGRTAYDVFSAGGYFGIMFDTANGREYRRVTGAILTGEMNSRLQLSTAIGSAPGDNVFSAVTFLMLVRVDNDRFTLRHDAMTSSISFSVVMARQ